MHAAATPGAAGQAHRRLPRPGDVRKGIVGQAGVLWPSLGTECWTAFAHPGRPPPRALGDATDDCCILDSSVSTRIGIGTQGSGCARGSGIFDRSVAQPPVEQGKSNAFAPQARSNHSCLGESAKCPHGRAIKAAWVGDSDGGKSDRVGGVPPIKRKSDAEGGVLPRLYGRATRVGVIGRGIAESPDGASGGGLRMRTADH